MDRFCYIGKKPCGCTVAVVVDNPDYMERTAQSVYEFIMDGLTIERVSLDDFRTGDLGCIHDKQYSLEFEECNTIAKAVSL